MPRVLRLLPLLTLFLGFGMASPTHGGEGDSKDPPPRKVHRPSRIRPPRLPAYGVAMYPGVNRDAVATSVRVLEREGRAGRITTLFGGGAYIGILNGATTAPLPGVTLGVGYHMADPAGFEIRAGLHLDPGAEETHVEVPVHLSFTLQTPSLAPLGLGAAFGATFLGFHHDMTEEKGLRLSGVVVGPHIAAGPWFRLSRTVSLETEVRLIHYFTRTGYTDGGAVPVAAQASVTLNVSR